MATYFLRPPLNSSRAAQRAHRKLVSAAPQRSGPRRRWPLFVGGALIALLIAAGALAVVFKSSKPTLVPDGDALAKISMPLGGGTIQSVTVTTTGKHSHAVKTHMQGKLIYPSGKLAANTPIDVAVTIKRPGWLSWLTGSTQTLHLGVTTPVASLKSHFLTVKGGDTTPLTLSFKSPVEAVSYGTAGHMTHKLLPSPQTSVTIPRPAVAGTELVAAQMRSWERSKTASISWFPSGGAGTVISTPAPGATIAANTPITLTFSKPVSKVLNGHMPTLTPAGSGAWKTLTSHSIEYMPSGYGYGIDAKVSLSLPSGVNLVSGGASSTGSTPSTSTGTWTVPGGSITRLQQMLSFLGYLPFKFSYSGGGKGVPNTPLAQEAAATNPPAGTFDWAYPNVPSYLKSMWQAGTFGTMTKGAIMKFENDNGMTTDGVPGPAVWKAMIANVIAGKTQPGGLGGGYTAVLVTKGSPEQLSLWHNGKTALTELVNTGVPGADTADGTFPVFEHALSVTMSGTNVDGSHYVDPGIPYVSYFNGGDALHGYIRPGYGYPQSNGCVEMAYSSAAAVYPYTPIGTLVTVTE